MSYELTPKEAAAQENLDQAVSQAVRDSYDTENEAITEWILVAACTDLGTGTTVLRRLTSRDLLAHHRDGLLHQALNCNWLDPNDDEAG